MYEFDVTKLKLVKSIDVLLQPPPELDYPKFRGAVKVSYINDHPMSLFNYKRAVNMARTHPAVR